MEEKKTEFKKDIKQSKQLPRFRYSLGVSEHKMLLAFFGQLKQYDDAFVPEKISLEDIVKYCGFDDSNSYRIVKKCAKNLTRQSLEYYNGKDYSFISWFSYITYKDGTIYYQLNNAIKSELLQLYENEKLYVTVNPALLPHFKTNYGLRFYLILKGDLTSHRNEIAYSLEEICYMLALSETYNPKNNTACAASNQRAKIIDPAIKEINEISNIHIDYEAIKEGRKTIGWKFYLSYKIMEKTDENTEIPLLQSQTEQKLNPAWYQEQDYELQETINNLKRNNVDRIGLSSILNIYENKESFIKAAKAALTELQKAQLRTSISNPGGFLVKTIKVFRETEQADEKEQMKEKASSLMRDVKNWEEVLLIVKSADYKLFAEVVYRWAIIAKKDLLNQFKAEFRKRNGYEYDEEYEFALLHMYGSERLHWLDGTTSEEPMIFEDQTDYGYDDVDFDIDKLKNSPKGLNEDDSNEDDTSGTDNIE